jgi:DNA-binding PucR family transcriptional regulator
MADITLEDLVPALLADLPAVLDDVGVVLGERWPSYGEFLRTQRAEVLGAGEQAIRRIVATADQARTQPLALSGDDELVVFAEVGRAQWRNGASLTGLLSAYQAGARAAWRRMSQTAVTCGAAGKDIAALAESLFALVDGLSRASTTGYVEEQSANAAERERARGELVGLLLTEGASTLAIAAAAERARWRVPEQAAAILVTSSSPVTVDLIARITDATLLDRRGEWTCLVVPEPDRVTRDRLHEVLHGAGAVIGPTVPLDRLFASLRVTQIAAGLQRSGVFAEDPLFAEDHLDAVIVHRDPRLLEALRAQVLAPLGDLPPETRQRLEETLRSWLRNMGDRQAMAAELFIHRQTVRYRMAQLQSLFGGTLDDAATRSKLTLALAFQPTPVSGATDEDDLRSVS